MVKLRFFFMLLIPKKFPPEKMVLLAFKKEKVAVFSICIQASEKYQIPSSSMFTYSTGDVLPVANSKEVYDGDGKIPDFRHAKMKYISKHQV